MSYMSFTLHIDTGNAAFDGGDLTYELARILHNLADTIEPLSADGSDGTVRDINGNTVGTWTLDADTRKDDR